jgi:hypothetical protein
MAVYPRVRVDRHRFRREGPSLSPLCLQAVLVITETIPDTPVIRGHDFNSGRSLDQIMESMLTTGFQATTLGQAINEVNRMVRASHRPASLYDTVLSLLVWCAHGAGVAALCCTRVRAVS